MKREAHNQPESTAAAAADDDDDDDPAFRCSACQVPLNWVLDTLARVIVARDVGKYMVGPVGTGLRRLSLLHVGRVAKNGSINALV